MSQDVLDELEKQKLEKSDWTDFVTEHKHKIIEMIKNPTCYKSFTSFVDDNYAYEKTIRQSILDLVEEYSYQKDNKKYSSFDTE